MVTFVPLALRWKAFNLCPGNGFASDRYRAIEIERCMMKILGEWEDTPYNTKFADKGVGVYCSAFVCRVLDELYQREPTALPAIPADIGFHSREGAAAGLHWFMRTYPAFKKLQGIEIEPGDILITGPVGGGPGHAMIVGPRENTLWQADEGGVHYTGMSLPDSYELYDVFRSTDREKWFR